MAITRRIPFNVTTVCPPGEHTVNILDLKGSNYGISYDGVISDITVSVCAIIYYENGNRNTITSDYGVRKGEQAIIDGDLIPDAFSRHQAQGSPKYIEFIITPLGCDPFKWRIHVE